MEVSFQNCLNDALKRVRKEESLEVNFQNYLNDALKRVRKEEIMNINTKNLVSITEANRNFSKVARLADAEGPVVILKNNRPKYLLIDFSSTEKEQYAPDEDVLSISRRLIAENRQAYEELAK